MVNVLYAGRAGIQCTNKYADICEAIASSDCSLVAQKYIGESYQHCTQ